MSVITASSLVEGNLTLSEFVLRKTGTGKAMISVDSDLNSLPLIQSLPCRVPFEPNSQYFSVSLEDPEMCDFIEKIENRIFEQVSEEGFILCPTVKDSGNGYAPLLRISVSTKTSELPEQYDRNGQFLGNELKFSRGDHISCILSLSQLYKKKNGETKIIYQLVQYIVEEKTADHPPKRKKARKCLIQG